MAIVVDASVAAAWCFPNETGSVAADAVAEQLVSENGIVPGIFWYEIRNVLIAAERRGRIEREEADRFLRRLDELRLEVDHAHSESALLGLARRHQLTIYDAAYLETAVRRRAALATLDTALAAAAVRERVVGQAV